MVTSGSPATLTMSPGFASRDVHSFDAAGRLEAGHGPGQGHHPPGFHRAGRVVGLLPDDADALPHADRAVPHPADRHPPDVLVGRQVRDEQLQRVIGRIGRRGRHVDQQVEERAQVLARLIQRRGRRTDTGIGVHDLELDLRLVGPKVHEQLVDVVEHLARPSVGPIDLVQGDDHRQPPRHRLLEDIAGLRERPFGGIDEEQHRVDHEQGSLDLAAEVGVTRCVDDVEPDVAVLDGRLLGQDRDALLAFEVHRVEHAIDDGLVRTERAGLAEHGVDERGLAVVDVGDDRDVAHVVAGAGGHGDGVSHIAPRPAGAGRTTARTGRC